jgi:hypothetical protein
MRAQLSESVENIIEIEEYLRNGYNMCTRQVEFQKRQWNAKYWDKPGDKVQKPSTSRAEWSNFFLPLGQE